VDFVIVHEGLKIYIAFCSLHWSANFKRSGQYYCTGSDLKVGGGNTKATIWHYWIGTTEFVRYIDFFPLVPIVLMQAVCELPYDPVVMCIT